mgnify:CR=1 FL=1
MDNIILSIINNQTLVDIIQELHPNWSKKIRPYEDLQSFLLSADNNQISNNILIFDIDEKSLTKDDLAKIKIPVICLTNNLNEDVNFYSLRGLRVEKILKPFKINIFFLKVKLCQSKNKFQEMSFVKISNYQLDTNKREIIRDKRKLKLTEREVDLLIFLKETKTPVIINEILTGVWKYSNMSETHTVETHVHRLRKKFFETFGEKNIIKNNAKGYYI